MSNPDLALNALAKPEPHTRVKARADRQQAKADKEVYAYVSDRDGLRCRACGEYGGVDIHRHHLRGRAFTTASDVCCLCDDCHGFLHIRVGGKLLKLSGDANARDAYGALNGLTLETRQNDGSWRVETGL